MSLVKNTSILTKHEDCFCCCVILPIIQGDSISLTRTRTCVHFEMNQVPNVGVRDLKNFDVVLIGFLWIKLFEPKTASPWTASFIDGNVLARIECCFELCITHINEWLQFGQRLMLWVRVGGICLVICHMEVAQYGLESVPRHARSEKGGPGKFLV